MWYLRKLCAIYYFSYCESVCYCYISIACFIDVLFMFWDCVLWNLMGWRVLDGVWGSQVCVWTLTGYNILFICLLCKYVCCYLFCVFPPKVPISPLQLCMIRYWIWFVNIYGDTNYVFYGSLEKMYIIVVTVFCISSYTCICTFLK